MTYKPHFRITARFNLGSLTLPKETASCTLNFRRSVSDIVPWPFDGLQLQTLADAAFTDWTGFIMNSMAKFSYKTFLAETRAYEIDETGHMVGEMRSHLATEPIMGSSSADNHPWSVSTALTLVGDPGDGHFGRIFLPPQCLQVDPAEGCMSQSAAEGVLAAAKTFVENISDRPGIDEGFALVIASKKGSGRNNKVNEIRVGRVMDTQRRRRRSLDENYVVDDVST